MIMEFVVLVLTSLLHVSYVPMNWDVFATQLMDNSLIMQEAVKIVNLLTLTLVYNVIILERAFVIQAMESMLMLMECV